MKSKVLFLSLLATMVMGSAFAQVEEDDMYFNASDRAKLREARKSEALTLASARTRERDEEGLNPTDSYSARNVNPEFTSRSQSEVSEQDEEDYFVSNYRYNNAVQYNRWNNNFNNWYGSNWYQSNYWGPSIYGWNSPYYGSAFDRWGSPWANPYYRSGWSSSFSFYYGNSWGYGWNGYHGAYDPFWGYPSMYSPYYYPGGGFAYNYGPAYYNYYPRYTVIVENNSRGPAYGKRASRSSQYDRESNRGTVRSSGYTDNGVRPNSNGRTNGRERTEYYDNSWRNSNTSDNSYRATDYSTPTRTSSMPSRSSNSNSDNSRSSSWESQQRSTYTPPSPSRSFDSGTRSSGNSGGGGNSGGSSTRSSRSSRGN